MEEAVARYISDKLVQEKIILSELKDVYVYGLELILSFLTATFMILLIGIIFHKTILTLVFLFIFIALRRFTGGYHASTYLRCKISTISTYLSVLVLSLLTNPPIWSYIPLYTVGMITILQFGPIENKFKPLTPHNKIKNKTLSLIVYIGIVLFGVMIKTKLYQVSNIVFYTLTSIIALMIIPILKKGGKGNEKED